jgi:phenylalanyl-tRNA synthetase beta chain
LAPAAWLARRAQVPRVVPFVSAHGSQQPLNHLQEHLRIELAAAGYTEVLVFALSSVAEAFAQMRLPDDGKTAVVIANPKTQDFAICRTSLLPGLLKTAASNKKLALPWQYFEVSDVVLQDTTADVGARNSRRVSALCMVPGTSGFEVRGRTHRASWHRAPRPPARPG